MIDQYKIKSDKLKRKSYRGNLSTRLYLPRNDDCQFRSSNSSGSDVSRLCKPVKGYAQIFNLPFNGNIDMDLKENLDFSYFFSTFPSVTKVNFIKR